MGLRRYWTVLATKQASSKDARKHVQQQGFEVLHLLYRCRPVRGVRQVLPLFPYYLLVRISPRLDWRPLASTRGVRNLFHHDGILSRVPDEHIARLSAQVNDEDGYFEHPEHAVPSFERGEPVRGSSGLFADCEGIYQGLAGNSASRVRVLFSILGQDKVFEVKAFDLVSAAA